MHIFLYGPPGAGKSTVGRLLAEALAMPFVDLDEQIEAGARESVFQIIRSRGEEAFREMESAVLAEVASGPERVIALGGGTLLRQANRDLAASTGTVVYLNADAGVLATRLHADARPRPLLADNLGSNLVALLEKRADHYQAFANAVDAIGDPGKVAGDVQVSAGRFRLKAMTPCDVIVRRNGLPALGTLLKERGMRQPIVVSDEVVAAHHAEPAMESLKLAGFEPALVTIPAGEFHKSLETVTRLWSEFLDAGLDRRGTVVALGGGVVSDLAGFAASTFMRGVPWVAVPTTLLSMVDASLGGKTGFDLPQGKNLIGTFHAPRLVLADPELLDTLPERELRSGMAEVVKHGLIADPQLFEMCTHGAADVKAGLEFALSKAMAVKIRIIEDDPFEQGMRAALNVGHTVGHAVELASNFELRHGEAIAIGMVAEARLAERMKLAGRGLSDRIAGSLAALGLPVQIPQGLPRAEIMRAMRADKKRANGIVRFALPVEVGQVKVGVEVPDLDLVFQEG